MANEERDDDDEDDNEEPEAAEKIDSDHLATILQGTRAFVLIPWPADPSMQVGLRPLSREEVLRGASSAKRYIDSLGLLDVDVDTVEQGGQKHRLTWLHLAMRDEWLSIALRRPEERGRRPLFASAGDLRAKLTTDETDRLYEMLSDHMVRCMPLTVAEQMGEKEEWLQLIEDLKKKPEQTTLVGWPAAMLREFLYFTISLLPASPSNRSTTSTSSD